MPAVAMATVRQVSRATRAGSRPHAPAAERGQKLAGDLQVVRRRAGPGLELGGHPSGHSSTRAAPSRTAGPGGVRVALRAGRSWAVLSGSASPPGQGRRRRVGHRRGAPAVRLRAGVQAGQALGVTCAAGRSKASAPSRRPTMRGKCASATSTWCSVATRVTRRAARLACTRPGHGLARARGVQRRQRLVDQPQRAGASSARARPTRWRSPPESRSTRSNSLSARSKRSSAACAAGMSWVEQRAQAGPGPMRRQAAGQHRGHHPLARRQRRHLGRQEEPAAQALQAGRGSAQGSVPSSCSVPAVGGMAQASTCSRVVLPAPEGPITATCSPAATCRRSGCSAGAAPGARGRVARGHAVQIELHARALRAGRRCARRPRCPCSCRPWWG
jgi:hypothetical protein